MNELIERLTVNMGIFIKETAKLTNKTAAARARKLSMTIAADLKQYRKDSIK